MKYYFFAVIEDGYAHQFMAIPEEHVEVYRANAPTSIEVTEKVYNNLSSYRDGRIAFEDGKFYKENDSDDLELMTQKVKGIRDRLLQESDWVTLRAIDDGYEIPLSWKVYRQALRDIPSQSGYPFEVKWPTKP